MTQTRPHKGRHLRTLPTSYVVIDIETTGLRPEDSEIIEIAALRVEDGVPTERFCTLVRPTCRITPFITGLTGIDDAMVQDAPDIAEAIAGFAAFVGDSVLMGYNVGFDIGFLYDAMVRALEMPLSNDYVDVLRLARKALPQLENRRQTTVAAYYGVSPDGAHRALRDCQICHAVYQHLCREPKIAAKA